MTVQATVGASVAAKPFLVVAHSDAAKRQALLAALAPDFTVHSAAGGREAIALLGRSGPRRCPGRRPQARLSRCPHPAALRPGDGPRPRDDRQASPLGQRRVRTDAAQHVNGWVDEVYEGAFDAERIRRRVRSLLVRKTREKRSIMRTRLGRTAGRGRHRPGRPRRRRQHQRGRDVRAGRPAARLHPPDHHPDGRRLHPAGHRACGPGRRGGRRHRHPVPADGGGQPAQPAAAGGRLPDRERPGRPAAKYPFLRGDNIVAFTDPPRIEFLLAEAFGRPETELTVIGAGQRTPVILRPAGLELGRMLRLTGESLDGRFKTSDALFVSFQSGYATYTFETVAYRIAEDGRGLDCLYPRVVFYSEKRATRRAPSDEALELEITLPPPFQRLIRGPVADISTGGASFLTADRDVALLIGTPLASIRIIHGGQVVREVRGEIRNVLKVDDGNGGLLRYGVQFGIARVAVQVQRDARLRAGRSTSRAPTIPRSCAWRPRRQSDLGELAKRPTPTSSAWRTPRGEEIVGLLNTSFPLDGRPGPGRHHSAGLRQDQGNAVRPGPDDHRELPPARQAHRRPPLRRRPPQGRKPQGPGRLRTALRDAPRQLQPRRRRHQGRPGLARPQPDGSSRARSSSSAFSLSALEARVVLRDEATGARSSTGSPAWARLEFRDLMTRVNCGLDFLEQYQLGIDLGVMPVLGNLVNVDAYAADVVANGVATLDQAREDMAPHRPPDHLDLRRARPLGQARVRPRHHERPRRAPRARSSPSPSATTPAPRRRPSSCSGPSPT